MTISQLATSQKWISQATTFQRLGWACFMHATKESQALRLGLARGPSAVVKQAREPSSAAMTKLSMGKLHIWEVAAWENTFGKVPFKSVE